MSSYLDDIKRRAAKLGKTIVLCEGEDKRVVEAAARITREGIAKIVLVGNEEECMRVAPGIDLTGITLIDPLTSELTGKYAALLYELRKEKGMTEQMAAEAGERPHYVRRAHAQSGRRRRIRFGSMPFHGQHAPPGTAGNKDRAGYETRFQLFYNDRAGGRQ